MDPRETPCNGRVAHVSLKGLVEAERFVEGETRYIRWSPSLNLYRRPGQEKDRELIFGEAFRVLEPGPGFVFGYAEKDGYVGYVEGHTLIKLPEPPTHKVISRLTYALAEPDVKTSGEHVPLVFGARVLVVGTCRTWSEIAVGDIRRFVPTGHLAAAAEMESDPAAVAERLLGTPYVWGGNSTCGIDCSGLVQAALLACAIPCPGDSDQQEARVGIPLAPDTQLQRGDLIFWRGHVAMALDAETIIHANAHHMAVAIEPLAAARERIEAANDGPVTSLRRP